MKPSFLLTASQRKKASLSSVEGVLYRYADVYASRFVWDTPDNIPEGWIERSLYWYGCIGAKEVGGIPIVLPAGPVKRDLYGWPLTWVPSYTHGTQQDIGVFDESDGPALYLGFEGMAEDIRPYAEVISQAILSLRTNITAMRTPVLVKGVPGAELQGKLTESNLKMGEAYIPTIEGIGSSALAEVLDLHVTDHTQALVNTVRAMDAEILTRMSIMNAGTGRESGVTSLETGSIKELLTLTMKEEERIRARWRDEVNDRYGWGLTFRRGYEGWNYDRQNETAVTDTAGDTSAE